MRHSRLASACPSLYPARPWSVNRRVVRGRVIQLSTLIPVREGGLCGSRPHSCGFNRRLCQLAASGPSRRLGLPRGPQRNLAGVKPKNEHGNINIGDATVVEVPCKLLEV